MTSFGSPPLWRPTRPAAAKTIVDKTIAQMKSDKFSRHENYFCPENIERQWLPPVAGIRLQEATYLMA